MTGTVETNCVDPALNSFPHTTCTLDNTNNALQNTVAVQQEACPGEQLVFSTCSQYVGDTWIRLFLGGVQVASNDDVSLGTPCSEIIYNYPGRCLKPIKPSSNTMLYVVCLFNIFTYNICVFYTI
jgi:hypothetical protein